MKFNFRAKSEDGTAKEGAVEAMSWEAAAQILEKNGLTPISIREEKRASGIKGSFDRLLDGVSQKDLVTFFQQLSTLIEARVPIVSSLDTIGEQVTSHYFRVIIMEMSDSIEDGVSFSEALEHYPDVFY
jgi:type II secretory pathway component PulF